jgi:hypothetical protein
MAKARKRAAESEPTPVPQVGDKVTIPRASSALEITKVHYGGDEVDLQLPGTNLQWFRVKTDTLTFLERAKTSNPFTEPEPVFNAREVTEKIRTVQEENLQRLDDDLGVLSMYLKTQDTPKGVLTTLDALRNEQHKSWQEAVDKITELLDDSIGR